MTTAAKNAPVEEVELNSSGDGLPEGWASPLLGEVVQPSKEKVEPSDAPDAPYLSLEHIEASTSRIVGKGKGSDVDSTKNVFRAGEVLYGKLRPYLNKVSVPDFDGICSTDILVFPKCAVMTSQWLQWFLMQPHVVAFADHHSKGNSLPRISFDVLAELEIPIAPLAEQKRIVGKVEQVLERVNAAKERLARVPLLLKRFRQAVLAAACSGRLTADWREQNPDVERPLNLLFRNKVSDAPTEPLEYSEVELPSSWQMGRIDELVKIQNGRAFPSKQYGSDGVRLLRPGNLHVCGEVTWHQDNTVCMPVVWARDFPDYVLGESELVMNLTAQSLKDEFLGRVCLKHDAEPALLNQRIARFIPHCRYDVRPFLLAFFKSKWFRAYVNGLDTGSLIRHMHSKDVARLQICIPPFAEQHEIVRRVDALFKLADAIEERYRRAVARVEKITQAVLARAFRGELVPTEAALARKENRPYEPASILLERIRASRATATAADKPKRAIRKRRVLNEGS